MSRKQDGWRRVLSGAIQVLNRKRWIRGSLRDGQGGFCTLGAMLEARKKLVEKDSSVGHTDYLKAAQIVEMIIRKHKQFQRFEGNPESNVAAWNDDEAESKEEVIEILAKAAHHTEPKVKS